MNSYVFGKIIEQPCTKDMDRIKRAFEGRLKGKMWNKREKERERERERE